MASQRSNARKRRGRRRGGLLYTVTSTVLILLVVLAGCAVFFRVNQMTVIGANKYTQEQVIDAAGIELGDNLFLVPRFQVGRDICQTLPYIDEVSVAQIFPDQLEITVSESRPTLLLSDGYAWWILDVKGKVLEMTTLVDQPDLILVKGLSMQNAVAGMPMIVEEGEERKAASMVSLVQVLQEYGLMSDVSQINLEDVGIIKFTYLDRFEVELPLMADYDWKIRALLEVVEKLQVNENGVIDMTREEQVYFDPA